jgi:hypothetical protein
MKSLSIPTQYPNRPRSSPRSTFFAAAIGAIVLQPNISSAQIAAWDFFGESSPATSAADVFNAQLDSSNLVTRGAGATASSASNSFRTQGFQNNGIAVSNTDFFQITLSASPGNKLSLSTIDARFAGTAGFFASPGVTDQFAYSLDGTTFTLIGSPAVRTAAGSMAQINLAVIPALQNVPNTTTVTIRYYASGQTTTGGWGFNSPSAGQYGLDIGGSVAPDGPADVTPPVVVSYDPADNSTEILPSANLVITYDETITPGASGSIVIRKSSDNSAVETITLPSSKVTTSTVNARINPDVILDYNTSYHVEVAAGTFKDLADNPAPAITGSSTWNFTTRATPPQVLISQYYEGASNDKFIELRNLTGSDLPLDGYRLAVWANADRETWKSGSGTTDRLVSLDGKTIPANGYFLIADVAATTPGYAANNYDLGETGAMSSVAFGGDDSVVLYNGTGFTRNEVVDAVSFTANQGADKSFHRLNNNTGFDFTTGSSILDYASTWQSKTLAEVASAAITDGWYLQAASPPETLSLEFLSSSLQENGGSTTATITRSGSFAAAAFVTVTASIDDVVLFNEPVEIPISSGTANFTITTIDNPWLSGNQALTIQVTCPGYSPGNALLTVLDDAGDAVLPVVINEVDSDSPGTDAAEFIELYNNSNQAVSLDGVVLVLYNGGTTAVPSQASYLTLNLTGETIPANGFLVVGNPGVTNVSSVTFSTNTLQNGSDAVALYVGNAASYPNGTLANAAPGYLVDAVVYETSDDDATSLISALTPGEPQADEGANPASETVAVARIPDGGARFDTNLYVAQTPTPGATNVLPGNTFAAWIAGYSVGGLTGFNDDFDKDGLGNAIENILGSSPAVAGQGFSAISTSGGNLLFRHTLNATPASDLQAAYEWSTDLVTWHNSGVAAGGTTVTFGAPMQISAGPPPLVEVTATVTGTAPGKVFVRLKVEQN